MKTLKDAIELIMAEPPEPHYPAYYADLLREADVPDENIGKCSEVPNSSDLRQQATKAIEESKLEVWLNDYDHCNGYNEGLETALEEIKNLQSVQQEPKWILVSEKLPENAGVYLVTNYRGDVVRYTFNNSKTSKDYWKRCAKAWLPVPKPYRTERRTDE